MENKKTKLTISGNQKKSFKNFDASKNQNKKTVVIDRQSKKPTGKGSFKKPSGFRPTSYNFKKRSTTSCAVHPRLLIFSARASLPQCGAAT